MSQLPSALIPSIAPLPFVVFFPSLATLQQCKSSCCMAWLSETQTYIHLNFFKSKTDKTWNYGKREVAGDGAAQFCNGVRSLSSSRQCLEGDIY